jgi:hypothetical protein
MPSHPLQKRFSPLLFALVLSIMPQQRDIPASKKARGGQLAIATKMAGKAKAGSEALKVKGGNAKGNGKRLQTAVDSSENSELEASEDEVSSADSSVPEAEVSQLKTKRTEGEKTKRRIKPATSLVEVTCHFLKIVHSHILI